MHCEAADFELISRKIRRIRKKNVFEEIDVKVPS